jgi:putative DNA primase/helicase
MVTRMAYPTDHLTLSKRGVFAHPADPKTRPAKKVASRIEAWAWVTVEGMNIKFVDVRFSDLDDQFVELTIPPSELSDARQLKKLLVDHGYRLPKEPKDAQMLYSLLRDQEPKQRRHIVHRQGWHEGHFVFANEPVQLSDRTLTFASVNPDHVRNFGTGGTLQGWQAGVARQAYHSTRLTLSISLAFAAVLLKFTDVENGGIHLTGDSSFGKTTFLLAAASVGGKAVRNNAYSWDNTKTGLEELAAFYNDNLLCLDEIQRAEDIAASRAKVIRESVFKLASGTGRIRSSLYKARTGQQSITWRILFLSTGEHSLNEIARIDSMNRLKGELVRAIDLPALVHDQYKGFETLPPEYATSAKLAEHIEEECLKHYGVALREFVKRISVEGPDIKTDMDSEMQRFFQGAGVPEEGWERRFAKRFALSYAAAKLALKYGIVPWDGKMIAQAINACYVAARAAVPDANKLRGTGLARLIAQLSGGATVLELPRSGHKVQWSPDQLHSAAAFCCSDSDGKYFLVKPKAFYSWFQSPVQAGLVLSELDRAGWLIRDRSDVKTTQKSISGISGRPRYFGIREQIIKGA